MFLKDFNYLVMTKTLLYLSKMFGVKSNNEKSVLQKYYKRFFLFHFDISEP